MSNKEEMEKGISEKAEQDIIISAEQSEQKV